MGKLILNGKTYTGNSANGFPPLIYSDDEREVGVWRDGKPLYQRTFRGTTSSSDNAVAVYSNSECDVVNCEGNIEESADKIQIGAYLNSLYYCGWYFDKYDNNTLKIFYSNQYKGKDYVITIYYTKTTDTAGSGYWSTNGDRAIHYSTIEQVIGTWIDGKPLYERVLVNTQGIELIADTWVKTEFDKGNIGKIVKCSLTNLTYLAFNSELSAGFVDDKLAINSARSMGYDIGECAIVLQYTKTTD